VNLILRPCRYTKSNSRQVWCMVFIMVLGTFLSEHKIDIIFHLFTFPQKEQGSICLSNVNEIE
jgi:hypothetical protein